MRNKWYNYCAKTVLVLFVVAVVGLGVSVAQDVADRKIAEEGEALRSYTLMKDAEHAKEAWLRNLERSYEIRSISDWLATDSRFRSGEVASGVVPEEISAVSSEDVLRVRFMSCRDIEEIDHYNVGRTLLPGHKYSMEILLENLTEATISNVFLELELPRLLVMEEGQDETLCVAAVSARAECNSFFGQEKFEVASEEHFFVLEDVAIEYIAASGSMVEVEPRSWSMMGNVWDGSDLSKRDGTMLLDRYDEELSAHETRLISFCFEVLPAEEAEAREAEFANSPLNVDIQGIYPLTAEINEKLEAGRCLDSTDCWRIFQQGKLDLPLKDYDSDKALIARVKVPQWLPENDPDYNFWYMKVNVSDFVNAEKYGVGVQLDNHCLTMARSYDELQYNVPLSEEEANSSLANRGSDFRAVMYWNAQTGKIVLLSRDRDYDYYIENGQIMAGEEAYLVFIW